MLTSENNVTFFSEKKLGTVRHINEPVYHICSRVKYKSEAVEPTRKLEMQLRFLLHNY